MTIDARWLFVCSALMGSTVFPGCGKSEANTPAELAVIRAQKECECSRLLEANDSEGHQECSEKLEAFTSDMNKKVNEQLKKMSPEEATEAASDVVLALKGVHCAPSQ